MHVHMPYLFPRLIIPILAICKLPTSAFSGSIPACHTKQLLGIGAICYTGRERWLLEIRNLTGMFDQLIERNILLCFQV